MANIRPDVHILESLRAARPDYAVLVGEGADNAFDADARMLAIVIDKDVISFQDDGSGITKKNELAIVRLGQHGPMTTTALGRYGIGITHHAVNAGNALEVRSTSGDGVMQLRVNWSDIIKAGEWDIDDPTWLPAFPGSHSGTQVLIRDLRNRPITPQMLERTREQLAQRFYPAIATGRVITLNGLTIPLLEEPALTDVIETTLTFPGGRTAHVRAGMLVDRSSRLRMVQVSYKHRVIMPTCDFGCGSHSGIEAMFARIDLNGPWGLGKFKNEIVDDYDDALADTVREVLEPLLERCTNENMTADIEELSRALNAMLPDEMIPVRPARKGPRAVPSTPKPERDNRHGVDQDAIEADTGPARAKRAPLDTVLIEFVEQPNDQYGYGWVSFAKSRREPNRIKLTKNNAHIVELRALRDRNSALRSLFQIALMLYEHAREIEPAQRELQFEHFGLRVWKMVERQRTTADDSGSRAAL